MPSYGTTPYARGQYAHFPFDPIPGEGGPTYGDCTYGEPGGTYGDLCGPGVAAQTLTPGSMNRRGAYRPLPDLELEDEEILILV